MQLEESHLRQITFDVCQSMLGLELCPAPAEIAPAHQLVASVEISGARTTIVEVFASDELIARVAEAMFQSDRGQLSQDEIRDAFGEVANMIGGNVKGAYGEETSLSLPSIGKIDDWQMRVPEGCLTTTFECCGLPLSVVLREFDHKLVEVVEP